MATIRKRGKTYQIRVSTGYDALYRQVVRPVRLSSEGVQTRAAMSLL